MACYAAAIRILSTGSRRLRIVIGVLRCAINVKRIAIEVLCIAIGVLRCAIHLVVKSYGGTGKKMRERVPPTAALGNEKSVSTLPVGFVYTLL